MPRAESLNRIVGFGYSDSDAVLLLRIEKDLIELSDVWNDLLSGTIGPFDAISQLTAAKYADEDILNAFATLTPGQLAGMNINLDDLRGALAQLPGGA
jgi:hypothetical protein